MEKITRVEGKDAIKGWEGSAYKSGCTIHSNIYYGVFQLPVKLCDELNAMCAKFLWGQVGNERKIHWKNWNFLSWPKNEGGMGFRDLR